MIGEKAVNELDELCAMNARLIRAVPLESGGKVVADFLVESLYGVSRVRYTLIRYNLDFSKSTCVALVMRAGSRVVALFKSESDREDFEKGATADKKFLEQQNKKKKGGRKIEI